MLTLVVNMPCLRCGSLLDLSSEGDVVLCGCGSSFDRGQVEFYSEPGFYREWLAALACSCGRVDHYADGGVLISGHRCSLGGVMDMDSPFQNN